MLNFSLTKINDIDWHCFRRVLFKFKESIPSTVREYSFENKFLVLKQRFNFKSTKMFEYLKPSGIFYYTLKCLIEDSVPHRNVWLRRFVNWYHIPVCLRYILAIFFMFTNNQSYLQYDIMLLIIVQYICIDKYILVCFFLLDLFIISVAQMSRYINRSPNAKYLNELVVLNVEDFTTNNPTLFPFQMWPFRLYLQKRASKINKNPDFKQIQLKNSFKHFALMSSESRIKMLKFVSGCESFTGVSKFNFGLSLFI